MAAGEGQGQGCSMSRKSLIFVVGGVVVVLAVVIGLAVGIPLSRREDALSRAKKILSETPLIDGHNDLAWQFYVGTNNQLKEVNLRERKTFHGRHGNITHTDIPRLKDGQVGGQFWALYTRCSTQFRDSVRACLEQADVIKRFVNFYDDAFEFVTTAQGIRDAFGRGRIASLIGMEGGHCIDGSLATLRMFFEVGVRYMTLTHNCNTPWADNNIVDADSSLEKLDGLTDFGKLVVKEMNRLGMLVDLSHTAVATMMDTLDVTEAPVIYSHSSVQSICNHSRNVPDDVLLKVKENKGVVMINFYDNFIICHPSNQTQATLEDVVDHIEYVRDLIGVDYVGIGADYDGVSTLPVGLEDVSTYPALFARMVEKGWSDEDLKKVAGENLLRVMAAAEQKAMDLQNMQPVEDILPEDQRLSMACYTNFSTRTV